MQLTEVITGYNQIMSMVSCNKTMSISYYVSESLTLRISCHISEALQVISDDTSSWTSAPMDKCIHIVVDK